jgi:glycerophosphoryl diester phosphodiesterase
MNTSNLGDFKGMPKSRISERKPIIVGHRGALDLAPENTIPAFEAALNAGADGVEFDVQRTVDGHLVIFHDEDVARVSDGTGMISEMTLAELKALDVGLYFDKRYRGTRIPTLIEFFDWAKGNELLLFVELKEPYRYPGIEQQIVALIREYDFVDRTQIRSFYHSGLMQINKIAPEIAISELWLNHVPWFAEVIYRTVNLLYQHYTEDIIKQFHEWGREVTAWVVDDLEESQKLKEWGIDCITTNNPEHILKIFDEVATEG